MQFRTTTLLFVVASIALPLTLSGPAGPFYQSIALGFGVLAWLGVVLAAWASDHPTQNVFGNIVSLTTGFFCIYVGALGASYCIAVGLSKLFGDSA